MTPSGLPLPYEFSPTDVRQQVLDHRLGRYGLATKLGGSVPSPGERILRSQTPGEAGKWVAQALRDAAAEGRLKGHVVRTPHVLGEPKSPILEQTVECSEEASNLASEIKCVKPVPASSGPKGNPGPKGLGAELDRRPEVGLSHGPSSSRIRHHVSHRIPGVPAACPLGARNGSSDRSQWRSQSRLNMPHRGIDASRPSPRIASMWEVGQTNGRAGSFL